MTMKTAEGPPALVALVVVVGALLLARAEEPERRNAFCMGGQCFAAFAAAEAFPGARGRCRELGGHLMTVRSSVAHDVLSVVLGNRSGRFWLGLHRGGLCPDPSAQLGGFLWDTGDAESDFSNWAQPFNASCESPRCVAVSPERDFQWLQEPCGARAHGFLCEYSFNGSCRPLEAPAGEPVSYTTSLGFGGNDLLSLPPGSVAVRGPHGASFICSSEKWLPAPWSCEILEGGCEYKCTKDADGAPSCYCPAGQSVDPSNRVGCREGSADPCARLNCEHACVPDGASHVCRCDDGFVLAADGGSCEDLDECADARQCPGEHARCVNTKGSFECECQSGYKPSGDLCEDEDECARAPCEHECANTPGSFVCTCYDGYTQDPDAHEKCKLHCGARECRAECDPNDLFQCYCPDGYIAEERAHGTVCVDIDECTHAVCDHSCQNAFGGYACSCAPGYELVEQHRCVREGGSTEEPTPTATSATSAPSVAPTSRVEPTGRPDAVTVGALTAIIVCTVLFIVLVAFLTRHVLSGMGKMKGPGGEAHGLRPVTSEA